MVAGVVLMARAAAAQATGTIAGTIADGTGAPLAGVRVTLYNEVGGFAPTDFTDSNGRFTISGLAPGIYYAQASDEPEYPLTAYGALCEPFCFAVSGTPIVVESGLETTVNFALIRAGRISGTMTNADTGQPEGGSVTAFDSRGFWVTYTSAHFANGTYEITGLRPGRYFLFASNSVGDVNLAELYGGQVCDSSCDVTQGIPVDVVSGQTTSGIDFALDLGGAIAGTVTSAATGLPLSGIIVFARDRVTGSSEFTETDANGIYRIPRLESGTYSVWARSFIGLYANQLYGGLPYYCDDSVQDCVPVTRMSTPVSVTAGSTTPNINFALPAPAELRGTVRDDQGALNGAIIVLYAADGRQLRSQTVTGSAFAITGLPAGRYYLVATLQPTHASAAYPSRDCGLSACVFTLGDPLDVVAGQIRTGLEIRLRRLTGQASIAGRIVASDTGGGLPGVASVCGIECISVSTDSSGQFTVNGLGAGTYYVRGSSTSGNYAAAWYGGAPVVASTNRGSPIILQNGQTLTGVELHLARGGTVRGTVTVPTLSPLLSLSVFIYDDQGALVEELFLSALAQGAFEFTRLPAGTYYLRAFAIDGYVVGEVYGGAPCLSAACVLGGTPVTLAAGETRDGVDFTLDIGGWIQGKVRARESLGESAIVGLHLYDQAGNLVLSTSGGRSFSIPGLPAGTYFLKASTGRRSVVYDGILCEPVCLPTAGTPIQVQAARATSGIVIVVDAGTSVSGVIRDADTSLPLSGVTVSMTDASGMFIASTGTDLNGAYEFRDLGPGRYFIRTLNRIGYVDELFDNHGCSSCVNSPATPIDVAGASPVSGIDFRLTRGGWISGRVTDANGAPVANLGVSVYDSAGAKLQRAVTASDGTYIVTVPAGSAFVQSDLLTGFRVVTYPDVVCSTSSCSPLAGTAVAVVAGAQTEGIDLELPIVQSLTITPAFLAGGETGKPYSATIQVVNGSVPVEFAVVSGALPPGLTLDVDQPLARARLLGTPTTTGVFGFAIRALDSGGRFVQRLFSITISPCVVAISQDEIAFAMSGGSARIRVAGGCGWQAATSASWINVASAAAEVTITVPPTSAARSANVTVASRTVVVRQAGPESAAPFGFLDIPSEGSRAVGSIAVGGWALDDVGIVRVSIYRDSAAPELPNQLVYLGDAVRVRGARPDVESLYPSMPFRDRAGWGFLLLTNMLPNQGNGTFRLHAVAEDVESRRVLLGSRTIVADNATATVPFGAIDTPGQGETISGNAYVNFGWALTQLPKTIPFDGSTITVYIDGASVGTVDYNHFRPDVATFFPGLNNTDGAIGFRILDTTQLTDGIHTISWGVTDDGGATEGIGSRYFHVDNRSPAFGGSFTESPNVEAAEVSSVSTARSGRIVRIREMERLTLDLAPQLGSPSGCPAALAGYEVVGHARRPLPAGSAFDPATAHFTWQPGPGFLGTYRLVFSATSCDGSVTDVPIDVRIVRSAR